MGRQAERAVALSDLTHIEALDEAQRRLPPLGVDKALARAGARAGRYRPTSDGSAFDSRTTRGVIVVAKIGSSSITDGDG